MEGVLRGSRAGADWESMIRSDFTRAQGAGGERAKGGRSGRRRKGSKRAGRSRRGEHVRRSKSEW